MFETEQNTKSQSASPGWNDPPPASALVNRPASSNRLHLQRQRRPVDPSIQGNSVVGSAVAPVAPDGLQLLHNPQQQQFHQSRSFPQLQTAAHLQQHNHSVAAIGTHPGSAFTPIGANGTATALSHGMMQHNAPYSHSQMSIPNAQYQPQATAVPPTAYAPLAASAPNYPHPGLPAQRPPSMDVNLAPPPIAQSQVPAPSLPQMDAVAPQYGTIAPAPLPPPTFYQHDNAPTVHQQQPQFHLQRHSIDSGQQPPQQMPNCETAPAANGQNAATATMIFSPPNIVPLSSDDQLQPTVCTNNYRIPVKAAGDVSLSGAQLVVFLTKATLLLPQGPTREGIQLRINQFSELVQAGQISEPCLKKLNFVVDAIDRHVYEEAAQFLEQMHAAFGADCAIGGWAHGVRLLVQELRKTQQLPTSRSHSAGTRLP